MEWWAALMVLIRPVRIDDLDQLLELAEQAGVGLTTLPKDADLLVTVSDDADLSSLARFACRLQGRTQALNRGADVFLLNANGRYLGRTCRWKDCRPGVRQSCDALHCGRRPFLHDDLESITLTNDVTATPPLELFPRITARVPSTMRPSAASLSTGRAAASTTASIGAPPSTCFSMSPEAPNVATTCVPGWLDS